MLVGVPATEELGRVQRGPVPCQGHPVTTAEQDCTRFNFEDAADGRGPDGPGSGPSPASYWVLLGEPLTCPRPPKLKGHGMNSGFRWPITSHGAQ